MVRKMLEGLHLENQQRRPIRTFMKHDFKIVAKPKW
jgi:hypothetical protein